MKKDVFLPDIVSQLGKLSGMDYVSDDCKQSLFVAAVALRFIEETYLEAFQSYLVEFNAPLNEEQKQKLKDLGLFEGE